MWFALEIINIFTIMQSFHSDQPVRVAGRNESTLNLALAYHLTPQLESLPKTKFPDRSGDGTMWNDGVWLSMNYINISIENNGKVFIEYFTFNCTQEEERKLIDSSHVSKCSSDSSQAAPLRQNYLIHVDVLNGTST